MSSILLAIPPEILQCILAACHPSDVAAFSKTCHTAYNAVYNTEGSYLWRELLIAFWDDPRLADHETSPTVAIDIPWKQCVQERVHAEWLAATSAKRGAIPFPDLLFLVETFGSVVDSCTPIQVGDPESKPSRSLAWLTNILHNSAVLYQPAVDGSASLGQALARLKVFYSFAETTDPDADSCTAASAVTRRARNRSRHYVYNLQHYTPKRQYGPFLDDGVVNWYHVHHVMNVVWANICDLPAQWACKRPPVGLEAIRAFSAPASFTDEDWAGVRGLWRRYICFMDYRDLFSFNFTNVLRGPRDLAYFEENPRFREATRLIELDLEVVPWEAITFSALKTVPTVYYPRYPPIFARGISRSAHGLESVVEGVVSMAKDGTVRYHFVSSQDGQTLWCSRGVQIGKPGCAAGVVGTWTTTSHEQDDPVGPYWLWKVADGDASVLFDHM
ncbi:hypothetical protein CYLTODRAFT_422536 [Cylindrobasidium torrendii FP15055 ss-10]|uniref:F-box domain-containing protein n=1 Tax=Cylindrobasidium torrendii FP15055 ss-10 TaxID=1314674 RepID=A0A0D7BD12_9AGAR|nr:hypothetical protein CYLTODRAFT_422536 [Cylindrobasidium torrendii FP15055 ss-10]